MNLRELLCKEFCGTLTVHKVPCGFAVGTGYQNTEGESLGFFIVGPDQNGKFSIEDDGASVSLIETEGVDLSTKSRAEVFETLRHEYNVFFDDDRGELSTGPLSEAEVPSASMRFLAFLLRIQDLLLL